MSNIQYLSWSDPLILAPAYSSSGTAVEYPSPVSRRPSFCPSEGGRRDSSVGLVSALESKGRCHSIGSDSRSPLAQFGFFKNLTEKKTTRGMRSVIKSSTFRLIMLDGQTPKRRGPKPDSKPALTRRQELNRQAQRYVCYCCTDEGRVVTHPVLRTHRERKEMYIKALEQEVLRLKETFGTTTRERDQFAEENRRLKELLMAHGIAFDSIASPSNGLAVNMGSSTYSSSGSVSGYGPGSASTGYTSPPSVHRRNGSISHDMMMPQSMHAQPMQSSQQISGLDYDQIGVDFVLTYDRTPYLSPPPQQ